MSQHLSAWGEYETPGGSSGKAKPAPKKTALIVAGHVGQAQRLENLFQTAGVRTRGVYGDLASPERVRSYLLEDEFEWLIISARHSSPEMLTLPSGRQMQMDRLLFKMPRIPEFVSILACTTWYLAQNFCRIGTKLALATATDKTASGKYWPFARLYLEAALQGLPAWEAFNQAQKQFQNRYPTNHTPGQFGLIGDLNFRIVKQPTDLTESVRQPDLYSIYENKLNLLLTRMELDHPHYAEVLGYQQLLTQSIIQTRQYGDTDLTKVDWARISARLDELASSIQGISFSQLCELILREPTQALTKELRINPAHTQLVNRQDQTAFETFNSIEPSGQNLKQYRKPTLSALNDTDAHQPHIGLPDNETGTAGEANSNTAPLTNRHSNRELLWLPDQQTIPRVVNDAFREGNITKAIEEPGSGENIDEVILRQFIVVYLRLYKRLQESDEEALIACLASSLGLNNPA